MSPSEYRPLNIPVSCPLNWSVNYTKCVPRSNDVVCN